MFKTRLAALVSAVTLTGASHAATATFIVDQNFSGSSRFAGLGPGTGPNLNGTITVDTDMVTILSYDLSYIQDSETFSFSSADPNETLTAASDPVSMVNMLLQPQPCDQR